MMIKSVQYGFRVADLYRQMTNSLEPWLRASQYNPMKKTRDTGRWRKESDDRVAGMNVSDESEESGGINSSAISTETNQEIYEAIQGNLSIQKSNVINTELKGKTVGKILDMEYEETGAEVKEYQLAEFKILGMQQRKEQREPVGPIFNMGWGESVKAKKNKKGEKTNKTEHKEGPKQKIMQQNTKGGLVQEKEKKLKMEEDTKNFSMLLASEFGSMETVNASKEVVKKEDPKVVFLMETKSNEDWMKIVRDKCFYGNPDTSKRPESWEKLKLLRNTSTLPWLVIGDFNELMRMSKKERGSSRPQQQMLQFVEAIDAYGLKDIGFVGPRFTWLYQRSDGVQIRERLDRALATADWVSLFPMAKLHHLTSTALDHSPLLLHFNRKKMKKRGKKLFRFESMWLKEPWCEEVVLEAWEEGLATHSEFPLNACLEKCRLKLDAWNKIEFGHVGRKINELQKHLEWLELQPAFPSII
uniref:Reverse transcriptase n=1 Tax=Quercus lobata TaxID=97700 RepID=A0A7N2LMG5_QUELO